MFESNRPTRKELLEERKRKEESVLKAIDDILKSEPELTRPPDFVHPPLALQESWIDKELAKSSTDILAEAILGAFLIVGSSMFVIFVLFGLCQMTMYGAEFISRLLGG